MNLESVNLNEIGTKAQSKSELYRLLTVEGGLYLPPQAQTNLDFVSDICFGDKKAFKGSEVQICTVPQVKSLRSENLVQFIVEDCAGEDYLPSNYHKYIPNRTFLGNICSTLDRERFQEKIKTVLREREAKILENQNLCINISSDLAAVFRESRMVTIGKGKSHKLLRKNILRKDKELRKLRQEKLEEAVINAEKLKQEIQYLKEKLENQEDVLGRHAEDSQILKDLFEKGIIDRDGNPL